MKKYLLLLGFVFSLIVGNTTIRADGFDFNQYKEFLKNHEKIDYDTIMGMHKQNTYLYYSSPECKIDNAQYFNDIKTKLELTNDEIKLLEKNNFVVLSRSKYNNFISALGDYWNQDFPLYFTSDALLFALHRSYDNILKKLELNQIAAKLSNLLPQLIQEPPEGADESVIRAYKDANLYISVANSLLNGYELYSESDSEYQDAFATIMTNINSEGFGNLNIFPGTENRQWDFSQLKPRGHYEDDELLRKYFKSMMWLGRAELYLLAPNAEIEVPIESLNRQTAVAYLIAKRINDIPELISDYNNINDLIKGFVGDQDNVQIQHVIEIANEIGVNNISELFSDNKFDEFRTALMNKPYSDQKILSQCLVKSCDGNEIKPASAFMVFGSRFVFDSFIFSNLVYDKVENRMMPKPMDILFTLGNNSASEFLQADFSYGNYGKNIASLRYLIDSYSDDFWNSSVYNNWLYSIKTLNPPASIDKLPIYMQSPAWWQLKMNTQLASWATLRHDNLLYAKQSYTGMPGCSYPTAMVEPVPEFYESVSALCLNFIDKLGNAQNYEINNIKEFLFGFKDISDKLKTIADKELSGEILSIDDYSFLKECYSQENAGCVQVASGWYSNLLFDEQIGELNSYNQKLEHLIADVHTQPADEEGTIVGKVLHVGTGAVNSLIIVTKDNDGICKTFVGPVFSYYEYITDNFERLTDSEWRGLFTSNTQLARPSFTKLYLADENGTMQSNPESLHYILGVDDKPYKIPQAEIGINPNPFEISTNILLRLDNITNIIQFNADIYDQNGLLIRTLVNELISGGNYMLKWDGKNNSGETVTSGAYFVKVILDGKSYTGNIIKN